MITQFCSQIFILNDNEIKIRFLTIFIMSTGTYSVVSQTNCTKQNPYT